MDSTLAAVVIVDADARQIVDANNLAAKLIGLPKEELIGRSYHDFICPPHTDKCTVEDLGQTFDREERILITGDGREIPILKTVTSASWQGRSYFVESFVDVSDRKKVEEEVNQLAKFPSENPNPVMRVTKDGTLIYANDASDVLLDFCECEIGKRIPQDWFQLSLEVFESGMNKNIEAQFGDRTFSLMLTPFSDAGYLNIYGLDITNRKQAEEHRIQLLEKLERTNRELNDFVYIASHDLRTPLRGIATLANWISTDFASKLDEEGREKVYLLTTRVNRMYNLLMGILQYSKLARTGEEKVMVDLNDVVTEIADAVNLTDKVKITIETKLPSIKCEKTLITQVFVNLIGNAVKYMDKPRGWVSVGCVEEEDSWKFSVSDNGPGIEKKYHEKIFKIFQTLSQRDEVERVGMGLAMVKKVVEMHDGKIWVESVPGQGSTFYFTLPKRQANAEAEKVEVGTVG